jgi:AraC-like DNA-binding protein
MHALVLPRAMLDVRFVSARQEIAAHLTALANRLERDLAPSDALVSRIAAQVRRSLHRGPEPLERVARALSTSPRSLQRGLAEEGTSYAAIVDSVRRSVVEALLDSRYGLDEIAERAGYGDVRALRRACHRWFGATAAARRRPRS